MLNKITIEEFKEKKEEVHKYSKPSDQRKHEAGLYRTAVWVDESWRGTEALANMKRRLEKPRVKPWDLIFKGKAND